NIRWAFTTLDAGFWHPLTWLSYMLDVSVFGIHPWGFHLTNVLLHAVSVALLFLLLRRMTGAIWRSAAVAILFALHPLHVEAVAWVAERKELLSTFFGMLSLMFYVRYAQRKTSDNQHSTSNIQYYLYALVFFALGLMSKTMLVTLPVLMLLLDFWPLRRV